MKEPKIRFKGFRGEWEKHSLAETEFSIIAGGDIDRTIFKKCGNYPVIANAITCDGILGYYENSYRVKGPAVTVTGRGEVGVAVPRHYSFTPVVRLLAIKSSHNVDVLANAINLCKVPIESTGVPQLTTSKLQEYNVFMPQTLDEEDKLASYFQLLDSLIQSTKKKIESLKQVKAASLQSMFPQEGETTPRVRFKGFEGEWSICPLKYFAKKSTEKNISMDYTITLTNSAEYGVINQRDFFDHDISNDDHINGYYVIHHDDFVYNPRVSTAAPVGPINRNLLGYSGVMSPLYLIFRVNGINKDFLSYYFKTTLWHNYMKLEGNTGARFDRLSISDEQFFSMPICVPRDEKEQRAIASYFTNLDSQITLQNQRLEKLKQIKSACLDNMFV